MNVKREFEEMDLDTLRQWIEGSESDAMMPEELVVYLQQLEKVNGWHHTMMLEADIIKNLMVSYPDLSRYRAKNIYMDAINYFYLDNDISQEAWANVYAERLDRLALATLKAATTVDQMIKVKDIWKEAATLRKAYNDAKEAIPAEFYEKRTVLYTQKLEDIGMPTISRSEVARLIDGMEHLPEAEMQRLKEDADIVPKTLFKADE